jgi:hypothetical protein
VSKEFTGELNTPIAPRREGLLLRSEERQKLRQKWLEEDDRKLALLLQHYEIQKGPGMYRELSLKLARQFVPGFIEQKKRGRKSKWTEEIKGILVVEIERLVDPKDKKRGPKWAAKQLCQKEPWASFIENLDTDETTPDPGEALRRKFYNFRGKGWANLMRDLFDCYESTDDLAKWDRLVEEAFINRATEP